MSFLDTAKSRYTTKKYNSAVKISQEQIEELKEILRLSPSSINSQPWKFTFVSNEEIKRKLASASYFNEEKINQASHLVVFSVVNDIDKFEEQIQKFLPEGAANYFKTNLKPQGEEVIKVWMRSQVYLSLGFFLAACGNIGIDSTPMEGINNTEYDAILNQEGYTALFAVALGARDAADRNQPSLTPKSRLPKELVVDEL